MKWLDSDSEAINMKLDKIWKLMGDKEPCMLWSMGSKTVRHNLATTDNRNF